MSTNDFHLLQFKIQGDLQKQTFNAGVILLSCQLNDSSVSYILVLLELKKKVMNESKFGIRLYFIAIPIIVLLCYLSVVCSFTASSSLVLFYMF